jgi:hypothetical protein
VNLLGYNLGVKLALNDASCKDGNRTFQASGVGTQDSWLPSGELKLPKNVKPVKDPPDTERVVDD